ncbi:prolipoprotein diacylglyceryl transferase [soil metagenome]
MTPDYFVHPRFNPIAFSIGPLDVRWYGIMYLLAFALFVMLARLQLKRPYIAARGFTRETIDDMLFWGVLGVIIGGRLGYVLFYKFGDFMRHPLEIFMPWHGGMSFHGGFLGVLVALGIWARRRKVSWWSVMDFIAPCVPPGLAAGRIGNFINGELWGRPTDVPWAMIFPDVDAQPRHPSQLYNATLEGLVLFAILWLFSRRERPRAQVSAVFLIGYGGLRFVEEFARQPDDFLGLQAFSLSMGQWLSAPMVAAGIALFIYAGIRNRP